MGARVSASIPQFLAMSADDVLNRLRAPAETAEVMVQYRQQVDAWRTQIAVLRSAAQHFLTVREDARTWGLLLEFEIPRRQKRPDVVLLANSVIFVIEFKVGASSFERTAMWQVEDYALDLSDFHAGSSSHPVVPVLVATDASAPRRVDGSQYTSVMPVQCLIPSDLAPGILSLMSTHESASAPPLEIDAWARAPYRPVLSVIEAAEQLYAQHSVREISHAYADNLGLTCEAVVQAVRDAQSNGMRTVCFVTGVPGSGKTLAGLSAVHDPDLRKDGRSSGVFLSGNVPLVRILCEALARNRARTQGIPVAECRRKVRTFVQSVHTFIQEYGVDKPTTRPHENVIVFDEAQRAWDAEQVKRKRGIEKSEAELVLDIMSRCEGWSVIVALIGQGQEIHKGEAGLAEWKRAIEARSGEWHVVASPHTHVGDQEALFVGEDSVEVTWRPSLHLEVSVRSPRAKKIHDWVDRVLARRAEDASQILSEITAFPIVLTRELEEARRWLRDRSRGERRCGLVASSRNLRHRAYGLELSSGFRHGYKYEEWFLADSDDVRSSYQMEVAASQFECQGLELDWVGLCWGSDFCIDPKAGDWMVRHFVGNRWQRVGRAEARANLANTYRVLLTRAREGLVLWIPPGSPSDPTLDPEPLNATADFFRKAGVTDLDHAASE